MKHESFKAPQNMGYNLYKWRKRGVLTVGVRDGNGHWKPLRPSTCFKSPRWTIIRPQRSWGLGLKNGFGWVGAFKVQTEWLKTIPSLTFNIDLKSYLPTRKVVFQPPFFRSYVKLRWGNWQFKGWIFAIPRSLWKGEKIAGCFWHIKKHQGFVNGWMALNQWTKAQVTVPYGRGFLRFTHRLVCLVCHGTNGWEKKMLKSLPPLDTKHRYPKYPCLKGDTFWYLCWNSGV